MKPAQPPEASLPRPQNPGFPPDFTADEIAVWNRVRPYTMTSPERVVSLIRAVSHVAVHKIPGAVVECGVWKGGSMVAAALTLLRHGITDRDLYLFDTFAGMSEPTPPDGLEARQVWHAHEKDGYNAFCFSPLDQVRHNLSSTGYPADHVHFVVGKVEDTLPARAPERIALLRLDTDWYESTRHELEHLFPRLSVGGVLIIDDYGHWRGSAQATDEYFQNQRVPMLLNRIDYTGRIGVKVG